MSNDFDPVVPTTQNDHGFVMAVLNAKDYLHQQRLCPHRVRVVLRQGTTPHE